MGDVVAFRPKRLTGFIPADLGEPLPQSYTVPVGSRILDMLSDTPSDPGRPSDSSFHAPEDDYA